MQALRKIIDVKSHSLSIHLPEDFNADKVEVIILPIEEQQEDKKGIASLRGKLNLSKEQYIDFQADVKNAREGWEKNI